MEGDRSLTQEEIDALLSAVPEDGELVEPPEEEESTDVRVYDFRAPDRLSREQIRTLQMVFSAFGRHFSGALSTALRMSVQVPFVHIEQSTFGDFGETVQENALTMTLAIEPLPGRCLVQFDIGVLLAAIDRLLGGRGKPVEVEADRELTDIEIKLISGLLSHFETAMREAWSAVLDVQPSFAEVSGGRQMVQIALPSDSAVMAMFEVRLQEVAGMMTITMPYELLKPVAARLTPQAWIAAEAINQGVHAREEVEAQVERVPVRLAVALGTANLKVRELTNLAVGDVMVLDAAVKDQVSVLVEGKQKYRAWPGLVGNRRAVKITEVLEDDEWL